MVLTKAFRACEEMIVGATRNCPETATKLPGRGPDNSPLMSTRPRQPVHGLAGVVEIPGRAPVARQGLPERVRRPGRTFRRLGGVPTYGSTKTRRPSLPNSDSHEDGNILNGGAAPHCTALHAGR